jgi:hypothetical protein
MPELLPQEQERRCGACGYRPERVCRSRGQQADEKSVDIMRCFLNTAAVAHKHVYQQHLGDGPIIWLAKATASMGGEE